jgi:hypothetical protein
LLLNLRLLCRLWLWLWLMILCLLWLTRRCGLLLLPSLLQHFDVVGLRRNFCLLVHLRLDWSGESFRLGFRLLGLRLRRTAVSLRLFLVELGKPLLWLGLRHFAFLRDRLDAVLDGWLDLGEG